MESISARFSGPKWTIPTQSKSLRLPCAKSPELQRIGSRASCFVQWRIRELTQRLGDYPNGTVRMGEGLHELRAVVAPLPDELLQLEQRDPDSLFFAQAAKLVHMGASIDELTQACGLTQAEAELMKKLHG